MYFIVSVAQCRLAKKNRQQQQVVAPGGHDGGGNGPVGETAAGLTSMTTDAADMSCGGGPLTRAGHRPDGGGIGRAARGIGGGGGGGGEGGVRERAVLLREVRFQRTLIYTASFT